jgi:hypothetical protein
VPMGPKNTWRLFFVGPFTPFTNKCADLFSDLQRKLLTGISKCARRSRRVNPTKSIPVYKLSSRTFLRVALMSESISRYVFFTRCHRCLLTLV